MTKNRFGHHINILGRLLSKKLNEGILQTGLTSSQWPFIVRLLLNGELTQRELCEQLSMEASTVSQTLNRMEQMGWIVRVVDDVDKREKKVKLTEKSTAMIPVWNVVTADVEKKALDGLTDEEIATFKRVLDKMTENMKKE
ncbi:MarR family winged helix-turn-helix transcriptional regulator [Brevibacillus fluminis]|uniref:MarR family winged helix-turn-helix transcriptional regulator n=1 Tax=Brevibacillus fluminis TaxID=511487 RepID=UPI003F8C3D95